MPTISISEFKARCLSLLEDLRNSDETLIITKHGKPLAEVRPCKNDLASALEKFRGSVVREEDIVSPVQVEWEASG